jgi:hypothetical protein
MPMVVYRADLLKLLVLLLHNITNQFKLVKPLAKRAIINNIDSFDKFINTIAKDGKIDIEGIVDEEIEIIKSIPNFDFNIPVLGNGNISNGNITLSIPFINKGIMFNQSDLETFRQLLTK